MIDGEYIFLYTKYIEFFINNPQRTSFYHHHTEPSLQQKCIDCARVKVYYELDSKRNPARKGMKCDYVNDECHGSDNVGCTYCRAPIPDYSYDDDY